MEGKRIYYKRKLIKFDELPVYFREKILTLREPKIKENVKQQSQKPELQEPTKSSAPKRKSKSSTAESTGKKSSR